MKKISADFRRGYAKVKVENPDDLWYLSQIIDGGDFISGRTLRKLKVGSSEEKTNIIKKPVFIKIKAEKIEFGESQFVLRVLGTVIEGPEDIPHGEHHSFNIEEGTEISIEKEKWLNYQIDKLDEAFASKNANIIIVVFDREEAYFALMKKYGYEILSHIEGEVTKKGDEKASKNNFYKEIIGQMKEYEKRYSAGNIIVASPAFWKDELLKNLDDESLRRKMIIAACSSVTKTGINEVLKRDEVKKALAGDRATKEINLVEELMYEIGKNGKAAYGIKEVEKVIEVCAVSVLLVTDSLIRKLRSENRFSKLENLMKNADSSGAKVHIISAEHEGGRRLNGLGGIGAILRYKLNY
jgi:protein pelota